MRTIRRISYPLNTRKWKTLVELVCRYAVEKDTHLLALASDRSLGECATYHVRRDELLSAGYVSPNELQAYVLRFP